VIFDVLFCEIRGRRCAIPTSAVREIVPRPNLTPVPLAPPAIRGLAPLRGQVLPLVDLGVWLGAGTDLGGAGAVRAEGDQIVVLECPLPPDGPVVRAALAVDRVTWLGAVDDEHGRPSLVAAPFVTTTVLDAAGPALLIDPARALDTLRTALVEGREREGRERQQAPEGQSP
jgi:chemotaxis signal transduction protein